MDRRDCQPARLGGITASLPHDNLGAFLAQTRRTSGSSPCGSEAENRLQPGIFTRSPLVDPELSFARDIFLEPWEEWAPQDTAWIDGSLGEPEGLQLFRRTLASPRNVFVVPFPRCSMQCELVALKLVARFLRQPPLVLTDPLPCALHLLRSWALAPPARCSAALNALKYASSWHNGLNSAPHLAWERSRPTNLLPSARAVSKPWGTTGWTAWRRRPLGEPTWSTRQIYVSRMQSSFKTLRGQRFPMRAKPSRSCGRTCTAVRELPAALGLPGCTLVAWNWTIRPPPTSSRIRRWSPGLLFSELNPLGPPAAVYIPHLLLAARMPNGAPTAKNSSPTSHRPVRYDRTRQAALVAVSGPNSA